ncbi:unnamed protein product [Acanthoscelides obtectus]|uniref:DNA-directed DNA polymerase n=1 Tax=Acanthoscelides obtectus TaxID=200917 RepID=A0A9P0NZ02_ACAOB|nr:unnamed protein product [Acanthoscelides obtectus]CAK1668931.1 hypothetical protein AOBTE_LOCUS26694 [Acanthoscelides obtectus]
MDLSEPFSESVKNTVKIFKKAYETLTEKKNASESDKKRWIKLINENLIIFHKALKNKYISVNTRKAVHTGVVHLKRYKFLLESFHVGRGTFSTPKRVVWEDTESTFVSRIHTGVIINLKHVDIHDFFLDAFNLFEHQIQNKLSVMSMLKVNGTFCGEFIKSSNGTDINDFKYFNTRNAIIDQSTNLQQWYKDNIVDKILNKLSEFQERLSGWSLLKIISLEININKVEFGNVSSSYVKLPTQIARKKACINIKNHNDNACFAWSIISALYPAKRHTDRTSSYPRYTEVLNLEGLEMPVRLIDISKFEEMNKISVNVFGAELIVQESKSFYNIVPLRLTQKKLLKHVNLLMIQNKYYPKLNDFEPLPLENDDFSTDDDDFEITYHYVYIKNLARLVSYQLSKAHSKKWICDRCLQYFHTEKQLHEHEIHCQKLNDYIISFPKDTILKFKNFRYAEKVPFIIYADFESMLLPFSETNKKSTLSHMIKYQKHEAFSAGYYFKCSYDESLSFYKSYRGIDCIQWFSKEMEEMSKFVQSKLQFVVPMNTYVDFKNVSSHCHICKKPFKADSKIVRDHCHLSGDFRGFAHSKCNLNYKNSFIVPVVLHNLSGYDSHFIIKDIVKSNRVVLLPLNKQKYISFTIRNNVSDIAFRFIDSFRFLAASLDKLVNLLDIGALHILKKEFGHLNDEKFELLTKKGVFPYDYVDSWQKLNETELPIHELFYNRLNDTNVSNNEYQRAKDVWTNFEIQNIGQYSDLYLKTDIILLADVFENFRQTAHRTHGLDPAWYYTLPGYTFDCMLRYTGCKIEILKDVDMLLFVERGIRGGISQCCNRYSKANNKYLPDYDSSAPSTFIIYLDVNALYAFAMTQYLPYAGFAWVENVDTLNVHDTADDADIGYILEVDLEYPKYLHDEHKDFPLCPEHRVPPGSKLSKLMTTLYDKTNYIIHYRNLKQALAHGLVLKKVHVSLQQAPIYWNDDFGHFQSMLI